MSESRPRALVVDDWPTNRRILAWILERAGYRCEMAVSGPHAVTALGRASYDLVLTDLALGGDWAGAETVRRLRDAAPTVKMVAIATDSSPEVAREIETLQVELVARSHVQAYFLDMEMSLEERIAKAVGQAIARGAKRRRWIGDLTEQVRKRVLISAAVAVVALLGLVFQWVTGHFFSDIRQVIRDGLPPKGPP